MKLLYFDYASVVLMALLLFTTLCRGLTRGRLNRCYIQLIIIGFISVAADIVAAYADNHQVTNLFVRYASHYIYLLTHNANTPLYVLYLMIVTDTDYKIRGIKSLLFSVPYLTVLVLMLTNPWNNCMFYIDDNLNYVRGGMFFMLYVSAAIYMLLGVYYLVRYGVSIGFRRSFGIGSILPLQISAVLIQLFRSDMLSEMFANAIAMLLISSLIHRPEDLFDRETGFSNKTACIDDVNRCIRNKKPLETILINISNYDSLRSLLDSTGMHKLYRVIASRINDINRQKNAIAELFSIGNGVLCLEISFDKLDTTVSLAKTINEALHEPIIMNNMELSLTPYVCIVKCPLDIATADALTRFAEELSDTAYSGDVLFASEIFRKQSQGLMRKLDNIIENALSNHLFQVYYQPIYSIEKGCFNSAEALIRLIDDNYGFVSPELFIPAAEKSGAIHHIGSYVLEEVCSFIASPEFEKLGIDYIEVNLSVAQCMRNDLFDEITEIMKRHNVKPSQINLEITETTASYSQDALQENVKLLNEAGINFSLDDYGTGYSNIERISSMVFDIIKLDKTFANVANSPQHNIVLAHTVSMIKELGMKIVVEGVETKELLDYFAGLKCDYIQGYYFSKPIPRNDFISFIEKKNHVAS